HRVHARRALHRRLVKDKDDRPALAAQRPRDDAGRRRGGRRHLLRRKADRGMSPAEETLAQALLRAFRPDFAEREASARQLSELLLDAVSAALPLTRHDPSETALAELEALAPQTDVYA